MLFNGFQIVLNWIIDAEVNDIKASTFHHHGYQILTNVMDITFNGADDHLAKAWSTSCDQKWAQNGHASLHGIGGKQNFGHKQNTIAKINADNTHALDEAFGQNLIGCPAAAEQDVNGRLHL